MNTLSQTVRLASTCILLTMLGGLFSCSTEEDYKNPERFLLGDGLGIDGPTLWVADLEAMKTYYGDTLGFNMPGRVQRGEFEGTQAISTQLADFSSIHFIAKIDSVALPASTAFLNQISSEVSPTFMFGLITSSADSAKTWLQRQGFTPDSVYSYRTSVNVSTSWSRDDGGPQKRSLDFQKNPPSPVLPRFSENLSSWYKAAQTRWNTFYSYNRSFSQPRNGVVGTSVITIAVDQMDKTIETYKTMGLEMISLSEDESLARFKIIRNQELHLISGNSSDAAVSDFLETQGPGVYSITLDVKDIQSTYDTLTAKLPVEEIVLDGENRRIVLPRKLGKGLKIIFQQEAEDQAAQARMFELGETLDSAAAQNAAKMYKQYCSLCHGQEREGYAADHAPSLKSESLLASSQGSNFMRYTIQFGREGTAMAGYLKTQGGPLDYIEIELILQWLYESAGVKEGEDISREPIEGDIALGKTVYQANCAVCHGEKGEGITAPALGNSMLLATATDGFLKYAIENGRDGTPMIAFKDSLSEEQINGVTAYLRSRASGWDIPQLDSVKVPTPEEYVLNPEGPDPVFDLREGLYVSAAQVDQAMKDRTKMIILDARSEVAWRQTHIPGSAPVPYYKDPEEFTEDIPNDGTWVVVYCACPHAASQRVVASLRRHGYKNTAILDEGILVWAEMGFPVKSGN